MSHSRLDSRLDIMPPMATAKNTASVRSVETILNCAINAEQNKET